MAGQLNSVIMTNITCICTRLGLHRSEVINLRMRAAAFIAILKPSSRFVTHFPMAKQFSIVISMFSISRTLSALNVFEIFLMNSLRPQPAK